MPSISRQGLSQRLVFFALYAVGVTIYASFAITHYRAQQLCNRSDLPSLTKAASLAPQDATYHDLICRSMIYTSQNPLQAVKECVEASQLDPYSSSIWLDLAQAYYSAGNVALIDADTHLDALGLGQR